MVYYVVTVMISLLVLLCVGSQYLRELVMCCTGQHSIYNVWPQVLGETS